MSLGQELKSHRETKGITLEEMASSTKIGTRYLEALESDNLEILPGAFITKSIIRSYANFIGLDGNEILAKYREAGLVAAEEHPASINGEGRTVIPGKNKFIIGIVIVVGLVLIAVAYFFLWKPRESRIPIKPKPEATKPQIEEYLPLASAAIQPEPGQAAQETNQAEQQPEQRKLVFVVTFQEETWIELFADGVRMVYDLKQPGDTVEIQADHEIRMNIGNAGGVTYVLNGRPGKTLGRPKQVLMDVRITLDNIQDFIENQDPVER